MKFSETLYFKDDNILKIILGINKANKLVLQEINTASEINNLTPNEFFLIVEIKKGFKKKTDISKRLIIKRQNLNLVFQSLYEKKIINNINNNISLTELGENMFEKTVKKTTERIKILFQKIESKNMAGLINFIESI